MQTNEDCTVAAAWWYGQRGRGGWASGRFLGETHVNPPEALELERARVSNVKRRHVPNHLTSNNG